MRIAVVDDESVFRKQITEEIASLYGREDVSCFHYSDGEEIIRSFENGFELDAVFLDIEMKELNKNQLKLFKESSDKQQEIDRIVNEVAMQRKDLEVSCDKDVTAIQNDIQQVSSEIERLTDMLSRQKGSLIEWLGDNVRGWEENIGKVLDENAVLYNTSLNPQKVEASDNLYGIKLNTDNIEKTIKTPDELKAQKTLLEIKIEELNKKIVLHKQQLDSDIADLERKPNAKLKQLRMEKMAVDAEKNQIPHRIELIQKERVSSEENLKKWRNEEIEKLQKKIGEIDKEIKTISNQRDILTNQRAKEFDNIRKAFEKQEKDLKDTFDLKKSNVNADLKNEEQKTVQHKGELQAQMDAELKGLGVDINKLAEIRSQLEKVSYELKYIEDHRSDFISWQNDTRDYFELEQKKIDERKLIRQKIEELEQKFQKRKQQFKEKINTFSDKLRNLQDEQKKLNEAISNVNAFKGNPTCPQELHSAKGIETVKPLANILEELRDNISTQLQRFENFKQAVNRFKGNFSSQNTFHFRTEFNENTDYTEFAAELNEFVSNNKIEQYRVRTSRQYATIIKRIAKDVSDLSQHRSDIEKTILDINRDFRENNFAGVIKEIELRAVESNDRLMHQLLNIKHFDDEHGYDIGQLNLFTTEDNLNRTNEQAVKLLMTFIELMDAEQKREYITLSDTFKLEFKVKENDNDTNWVEKLSNVGSDGTDILVKAMVNIMLINVFKRKISRKFGDFKLHCMMDEIGKLHPNNVEGILKFANVRNINLINSSPTTYNAQAYKYTYSLSKDEKSNTIVKTLLTIR